MIISKINSYNVNFTYKHRLKTAWKNGEIPELIHDFYDGSLLSADTLTLEHLKPHSQEGKTSLSNLVLTSYANNMKRSNKDIRLFINKEAARQYLEEASKIKTKGINGESYVKSIINRLKSLGVEL